MKSGIYKISNKVNGKFYIGSATEIKKRWREHKYELRNGKHHNPHFQFAWDKYGEQNFEFTTLQLCEIKDLVKYEQIWLDFTKCYDGDIGYNLNPNAANSLGYRHTPEALAKMAAKSLGIKHTQEHKDNKAAAMRKLDKWPHKDGCRCKCHECNWKKTVYVQEWQARKKIKCLNLVA